MDRLKKKELFISYRETVYRATEKLVQAGLAEKYYEKKLGICYKLSTTEIRIRISDESINIES
jgi:hypothetical protein